MLIKKIIQYRIYWMGAAMLWIVFFHCPLTDGGILKSIMLTGYGGVDIFLFASGIGNYYSYLRDSSPLDFIKRRISRLAPSWLPFIIAWIIGRFIVNKITPSSIIGNLLGIQGFTDNGVNFNWYITAIIICYLLTPYLAPLIKNNSQKQNAILIICLLVISTVFWNDQRLIVTAARVPIYCLGMTFAKNDDKKLSSKHVCVMFILSAAGAAMLYIFNKFFESKLWDYALSWYPFILITPFLCVIISLAISFAEGKKSLIRICNPILKLLKTVGKCSFEIFLMHILFFDIEKYLLHRIEINHKDLISVGVAVLSIAAAICYSKLIALFKEKISKAEESEKAPQVKGENNG